MCGEPFWQDAGWHLNVESHPWHLDLQWTFNVTDDWVYKSA